MILAARCVGWCDSPVKNAKGEPTSQMQRDRVAANGGEIPEPPVTAEYLLHWLSAMGFASSGMSLQQLQASEIQAWSTMAGVDMKPWEFHAIQQASAAYVMEHNAGNDYPPYGAHEIHNPDQAESKLASALDRLAG